MVHCWRIVEYYEYCNWRSMPVDTIAEMHFGEFKFEVIKEKKVGDGEGGEHAQWLTHTAKVKGRDTKATVTKGKQEQGSEKCKGQYHIVEQQLLKDNFSWLNEDPGIFYCKAQRKKTCWDKQLNPRKRLNDSEYKRKNFKRNIVTDKVATTITVTTVDNICCRGKQNYVFNWFIATNLNSFKLQKITISLYLNRFIEKIISKNNHLSQISAESGRNAHYTAKDYRIKHKCMHKCYM